MLNSSGCIARQRSRAFEVVNVTVAPEGNSLGTKLNGRRHDITHFAVKFDGALIVTNQNALC